MNLFGMGEEDACDLLDQEHEVVESMFDEYMALVDKKPADAAQRKRELAGEICEALTMHTTMEEEIFYPALRGKLDDAMVLDEAQVEHNGAEQLIADIQASGYADTMFDAKVKVLGEYIKHHVKEERQEMFPKARAAKGVDLVALKKRLEARKLELMAVHA